MTIAYDLRFATDHFTGIGTHAFSLFEALLELPGPERYVALWDPRLSQRRYAVSRLKQHPRVELVERPIAPLDPMSLIQVGAWLREVRPAVYFSPYYFQPHKPGCPTVLTLHDVWPMRLRSGFSMWRMVATRWMFFRMRKADLVLTSSDFSRREIIELLGLEPGSVHTVRLGCPNSAAVEPSRPAAAPTGPFALVVGDNRPRKNLKTLAEAWAAIGPSHGWSLVSAGPNDQRYPSLEQLAADAGASQVTSLGWVSDSELDWLYRSAEVILFPSRYEGFGFPLLEAFLHRRPAIAADIEPLRELGDGIAVFVSPDDASAWTKAVADMMSSKASRDSRGSRGFERAMELKYENTAQRVLELLREVAT